MTIILASSSDTITALELITRSMRLINAIAAGEEPEPEDANDALQTLNEMVDGWSTQSLAVYATNNDQFTTTPGKATYTYGIGGEIDAQRPVFVNDAYCIRNGVTTYVRTIDITEYNIIPLKGTSQPLVERLMFINLYPLAEVTLWPVPSESVTIGITAGRVMTRVEGLQTKIILPPGYLRALRYNLAVDLWPEYSNKLTDITQIRQIANKSLGNIKVTNVDNAEMDYSSVPMVETGRSWDWRTSS
jgi:hypothetical protein